MASARDWIDLVLGPGWAPLFEDVAGGDPLGFPGYPEQLERARSESGASEAVLIARGALGPHEVVIVSFEPRFLGGSVGAAATERICRAFEVAAAEGLALVALVATGGARMQEGMRALAHMPATLGARDALARAGRPFIAYVRDPTTGGPWASFASSADLVWAEPGATIGFAGPRAAEALTGEALPEGSHTAEAALAAGSVDAIVAPGELRAALARALDLTRPEPAPDAAPPKKPAAPQGSAWDRVLGARAASRPTGVDHLPSDRVAISPGGGDPTIVAALGRVPVPAVLVASDRRAGAGRPGPVAYRRARRAIRLAAGLGLPVVAYVDTPGAEPGAEAERAGIAREISETMQALLEAPVPTVAVIVGEGGSGGALALAAADRIVIQEGAIFSVIAPEAAATILRREDVPAVAGDLRPAAEDLEALGIADRVVPDGETGVAWALGDIARAGGAPTRRRKGRWRLP